MKQKTVKLLAQVLCLMLALILALTMLAPMMALSAFAEETNPNVTAHITVAPNIKEGQKKTFAFEVTDPDYKYSDVAMSDLAPEEMKDYTIAVKSSAFIMTKDKDAVVSLKKTEDESLKAKFEITMELEYFGPGRDLKFDFSYETENNGRRTLVCSAYIPSTVEPKPDDDDDDEDKKDPEPLTPHIIVETYSHGGAEAIAGENFTLELLLRNTSEDQDLENIVINVAPQGVFSMGSASNTIYIDELFAGNTTREEIIINTGLTKVTEDEDANSINMTFTFQYLVENVRKSGASEEKITVPVTFPDRFELSPPEVDSRAFTGEDAYVYLPLVNKGRSSVYNVSAEVRGDGIANPGQSQFIGNISAGSSSGADFSVIYEEAGVYIGEIVVTYEDTNMNPKEAIMEFSMTVNNMDYGFGDGGDEELFDPTLPTGPVEPVEKFSETIKKAMLIVGSVIALITAYITIKKAKVRQSMLSDEDF